MMHTVVAMMGDKVIYALAEKRETSARTHTLAGM